MITRDPRTQAPEIPKRLAEERGLKIGAVHGPFLVITRGVWSLDPLEKIRRGVRFCHTVGARSLIVHPPYLWERRYARWLQEEASAFSLETEVKVVVETMYPKWAAGRRLRAYRWATPDVLFLKAPWAAMDTSHLAIAREDIFDAYRTLTPKLVQVHLSNNAGDGRDGHLELDRGILPIDRFLAELKSTDYAGDICLELLVTRYLERPKELVKILRRNRQYVEDRLSQGSQR